MFMKNGIKSVILYTKKRDIICVNYQLKQKRSYDMIAIVQINERYMD